MVDDRDIREILIHNINVRFRLARVESLLAYQIALYLILRIERKKLLRESYMFLEFDSSMDLSRKLCEWTFKGDAPSKSSMKTAFNSLEKAKVASFEQSDFDAEEIELLELKKKRYLWVSIDLKELRKSFAPFEYNQTKHEYFESHLMLQINRLNSLVAYESIPLFAYQLGLRLIMEVKLSSFDDNNITIEYEDDDGLYSEEVSRVAFLFESYDHFAENFSYFFEHGELAKSSISDNLDRLHSLGFIETSFEEPSDFNIHGITNKKQLYIELYLELPAS
jgi:hypothetical protein